MRALRDFLGRPSSRAEGVGDRGGDELERFCGGVGIPNWSVRSEQVGISKLLTKTFEIMFPNPLKRGSFFDGSRDEVELLETCRCLFSCRSICCSAVRSNSVKGFEINHFPV